MSIGGIDALKSLDIGHHIRGTLFTDSGFRQEIHSITTVKDVQKFIMLCLIDQMQLLVFHRVLQIVHAVFPVVKPVIDCCRHIHTSVVTAGTAIDMAGIKGILAHAPEDLFQLVGIRDAYLTLPRQIPVMTQIIGKLQFLKLLV